MLDLSALNSFSDFYVWKKDINLEFVELNDSCAKVFGFKDSDSAIGKSDFDIPSDLSRFANIFRENDRRVINNAKKTTFLEIQPCANNEWKILHVVKQPYYENNVIAGVLGYGIDITKTYMKLEQLITGNKKQLFEMNETSALSLNPIPKLTVREKECLFFLLRRCTAKEIANILNISFRTVEHYIEILKSKFECNNKIELIQLATSLGYFNVIPESIIQMQLSIIIE